MEDIIEKCTEIWRRDADSFERRSVAWRGNSENTHKSSGRVNSKCGRNQNGGTDEKLRTEESTESSREPDRNEETFTRVQNSMPFIFPGNQKEFNTFYKAFFKDCYITHIGECFC